jgi:hypothetical protein
MKKGTVSTILSALLAAAGLLLPKGVARELIMTTGALAFTGGLISTVSLKFLFDGAPGSPKRGLVQARAQEFRARLKQLFLEQLFREEDLRRFLSKRPGIFHWQKYLKPADSGRGIFATMMEKEWERISSPETVEPLVEKQLENLMDSSVGGLLAMVGMDSVKPVVQQFVSSLLASLKGPVLELSSRVSSDDLELPLDRDEVIAAARSEIRLFVEEKLDGLDPDSLKELFEDALRADAGRIVVWGNVLGSLLGAAGYLAAKSLLW